MSAHCPFCKHWSCGLITVCRDAEALARAIERIRIKAIREAKAHAS